MNIDCVVKPVRYLSEVGSWELGVGSWELGVGSWELQVSFYDQKKPKVTKSAQGFPFVSLWDFWGIKSLKDTCVDCLVKKGNKLPKGDK